MPQAQARASAPHPLSPDTIEVFHPATAQKVAEVAVHDSAQVAAAVTRARSAQRQWSTLPFAQRARALIRFRNHLVANQSRLVETIQSETGKTPAEILSTDLFPTFDTISYYARRSARFLADQKIRPHLMRNKRVVSRHFPLGVVGFIGPWNFPFVLTIGEAIPALMAGNAAVIKPSEVTPRSALLGAELAREAGLPEGLLEVVTGYGATGAALLEQVDMISFTGSVETGRKVAIAAAQRLIPCSLELGGKDPMIVLRDANLDRAAAACVWGGLVNSGQVCISVERVYVEEPVYDQFVAKVVEQTRQVRQAMPGEQGDIGSMTFAPQLEKVERHVNQAVKAGATVLSGGKRKAERAGLFFEPTVLTGVNHEMAVMREETFGPVIPIMKVKDAEEALALANDSEYGLAASIFSADRKRAFELARRVEAGSVCINDAPMGGIKNSGLGRRHGVEGIRKFCRQQTVVTDLFGLRREFFWFPMTAFKTRLLVHGLKLLFGKRLRDRLRG